MNKEFQCRHNEDVTAEELTDRLNVMGFDFRKFCKCMGRKHRYLQGKFTMLCYEWLTYAKRQYKTGAYDARNEVGCYLADSIIPDMDGEYHHWESEGL